MPFGARVWPSNIFDVNVEVREAKWLTPATTSLPTGATAWAPCASAPRHNRCRLVGLLTAPAVTCIGGDGVWVRDAVAQAACRGSLALRERCVVALERIGGAACQANRTGLGTCRHRYARDAHQSKKGCRNSRKSSHLPLHRLLMVLNLGVFISAIQLIVFVLPIDNID